MQKSQVLAGSDGKVDSQKLSGYDCLKGKCIDFSSRAQMKDNWISVPMVYLSLAYGKGNLPYRRFPDPVSMATTGDDAHSA